MRFRAWHKAMQRMSEILAISYERQKVRIKHQQGITHMTIPLDEAILMQSTGLFDKNGKEIFEGDIVVNKYGNVGYVAYLQQEAGFVVVLKKSDYRLGHRNTGESYDVTTNHEIIGNIYENPELVEE
ncbi:YopX family protein [Streptococcus suis]